MRSGLLLLACLMGCTFSGTNATETRADEVGAVFEGWLDVPASGVYTLFIESDDGSRLLVDGVEVIDNDGLHAVLEKTGMLALKAGLHPIEVTYFESGASEALSLEYEGPGIARQRIPPEALCHVSAR